MNTKTRKPMIAGNTSKNQVKYSFGLIPERISPMKNNGMKTCGCFIGKFIFSLKLKHLLMKKQFPMAKFPCM